MWNNILQTSESQTYDINWGSGELHKILHMYTYVCKFVQKHRKSFIFWISCHITEKTGYK